MHDVLGLPPALTAPLVVGLGAWATGALHLDGLADTADGFGGGRTREDVLRIMRDPAIGAFGATALVIVLGTRMTALALLLERGVGLPFLVTAPALSRWTVTALAACLPYARVEGGLGTAVVQGPRRIGFLVATALTAAIAATALRSNAVAVWTVAALTTAWVGRTAQRRINGVTGDVFGACIEVTETAVLSCGVFLTVHA
jgi:cobalamin 5'-phosphate synthase/cobalamin synthase